MSKFMVVQSLWHEDVEEPINYYGPFDTESEAFDWIAKVEGKDSIKELISYTVADLLPTDNIEEVRKSAREISGVDDEPGEDGVKVNLLHTEDLVSSLSDYFKKYSLNDTEDKG